MRELHRKYLVRKGAAAPINRPKESIVLEEELPKNLHIIRESEGIGSLDCDPNRMTLLLNEKDEIVIAVWTRFRVFYISITSHLMKGKSS